MRTLQEVGAGSAASRVRAAPCGAWTPEPLPAAAARPSGLRRVPAASDGDHKPLIVQGEGGPGLVQPVTGGSAHKPWSNG